MLFRVEDDISKFVKIRLDAHGIDMENSVIGSNTVKNHRLIGIASEVLGDIYYYAQQPPTLMKHLETNKNNDDATRVLSCASLLLLLKKVEFIYSVLPAAVFFFISGQVGIRIAINADTQNTNVGAEKLCLYDNFYLAIRSTFLIHYAFILVYCSYDLTVAATNAERAIMNALERQYANILTPLKDSIPKRCDKAIDSIDLNGATRNTTRLRLFYFTLRDQAIDWLDRLPAGSISTWDDLTTRESLYDAWNRFKDLLRKVPHHGLDLWLQDQIFYDHVNYTTQIAIDDVAGERLRKVRPEEAWKTIKDLS
ncbi:hypothetical protein Tco_0232892 [Tanacetum coccineum]